MELEKAIIDKDMIIAQQTERIKELEKQIYLLKQELYQYIINNKIEYKKMEEK